MSRTLKPSDLRNCLSIVATAWCLAIPQYLWAQDREHSFARPVLIRVEGPITPLLEQFLYRKIDVAQQAHAELIIFEIDSPGGFVSTTVDIADRLRDLNWAHTVAYIPREAISGAAIISLACDDIVLAPHARIGDAGEIVLADDNTFRYVPEKQRSHLVRHIRDLASAKGRSPALAEAMVDMDLVVYEVRNHETGTTAFMSDAELQAEANPAQWDKVRLVHDSREKHFLTVNGEEAVALQLAVGTASSRDALQERYRFEDKLLLLEPNWVDTAVTILNWPLVTGLLFIIGLVALYVEFSAPGIGLGGCTACLCFSLFFWSRFLGGTSGWLEVILFVAGVAFVLVELFVLPGFGVAGISGLLLMVVSVVMASQHFLVPATTREMEMSVESVMVVAGSGFVFLVLAATLCHYFGSIPIVNLLVLKPPNNSSNRSPGESDRDLPPRAPAPSLVQVGDRGIADSALRPAGQARFSGTSVAVVSDGTYIDRGTQIQVVEVSGNRILVRESNDRHV